MTKKSFRKILEKLNYANLNFSPKITKDFIEIWYIFFKDVDEIIFAKAVFRIMANEYNYPSIAKVKDFIKMEIKKSNDSKPALVEPKPNKFQAERIREIIREYSMRIRNVSANKRGHRLQNQGN